uniref:HMG box domain-containing protein n=1 Tax=Panagrellus redivivus TaxID=6233 RepID=A0A7E4VGW4_PANRE
MSSIDSSDVHCDHSTADLCTGFEYFSKNKEEQLRQLKSFADKDSAYLTDLILKAWDSFSANDKAIYHEEANVIPADLEEWIIEKADPEVSDDEDEKDSFNKDEYESENVDYDKYYSLSKRKEPFNFCRIGVTYPTIIYMREMNSIIVQDASFSSNQKDSIKMLWLGGWILLRQEQREEYGLRSKKNWICRNKGSVYQQIAEKEFAKFEEALSNEEDHMALTTLRNDLCPHDGFGDNFMTKMLFFKMTPSQRDEYYEKGYWHRISEKAFELFTKEELTDDHVKGSYCMECDFTNLNDADKKCYLEKAAKIVHNYFENLRKGINDTASIEDYDAIPVFKESRYSWNENRSAFNIYAMKMRPSLLQEPGMADKRNFELNLILQQRWNAMESEDRYIYEECVTQVKEMKEKISERCLCSYNFFQTEKYETIIYSKLSAEEKVKFNEKKLADRRQLLEDYPNLMEYFAWQHAEEPYRQKEYKIPEYDTQMKEYPGKPFIIKQIFLKPDWLETLDPKGIMEQEAFYTFAKQLCTHQRDGLDVAAKWQRWLELSDAQKAKYYKKYRLQMIEAEARVQHWRKADPTNNESNMYCTRCGFDNLDKSEQNTYMKKAKRIAERTMKRDLKKVQNQLAKEERDDKRYYRDHVPKHDTTHLFVEDYYAQYHFKTLVVSPHRSLESNAFYPYFEKHISSFTKDPDNQHLSYSRICEKVEQSFWDLPEAERKPYFDVVIRYIDLKNLLDLHTWADLYFEYVNKDSTLKFDDLSDEDQAAYEKKVLEARVQLLRDNPDITDYVYFYTGNWVHCDAEGAMVNLLVPTPFMCFIHEVRPIMEQKDRKFKKKDELEKRWIMKDAWNKLSKEQKAVYYEKQRRVQDRVKVKHSLSYAAV